MVENIIAGIIFVIVVIAGVIGWRLDSGKPLGKSNVAIESNKEDKE